MRSSNVLEIAYMCLESRDAGMQRMPFRRAVWSSNGSMQCMLFAENRSTNNNCSGSRSVHANV